MVKRTKKLKAERNRLTAELQDILKDRSASNRQQRILERIAKIQYINNQLTKASRGTGYKSAPESWEHDQHLRKINDSIAPVKPLLCPKCKQPDRGNIMNGEPFCFTCRIPLSGAYSKPVEDWHKHSTFKPLEAV